MLDAMTFIRVWTGSAWKAPSYYTGWQGWDTYRPADPGEFSGPYYYLYDDGVQAKQVYISSNSSIGVQTFYQQGSDSSTKWAAPPVWGTCSGSNPFILVCPQMFFTTMVSGGCRVQTRYRVRQNGSNSAGQLGYYAYVGLFGNDMAYNINIAVPATSNTGWLTATSPVFYGTGEPGIYPYLNLRNFNAATPVAIDIDSIMLIDDTTSDPIGNWVGEDPGFIPKYWNGSAWIAQNAV